MWGFFQQTAIWRFHYEKEYKTSSGIISRVRILLLSTTWINNLQITNFSFLCIISMLSGIHSLQRSLRHLLIAETSIQHHSPQKIGDLCSQRSCPLFLPTLILLSTQPIPPVSSSFKLSYIPSADELFLVPTWAPVKGLKQLWLSTSVWLCNSPNIAPATERSPWEKPQTLSIETGKPKKASSKDEQRGNSTHKMPTAWVHKSAVKLHQASAEPGSADIFQCLTIWLFSRGSHMVLFTAWTSLKSQAPSPKDRIPSG